MNNFRLKVFISAARNLSFTLAASELNISQPAVSKHIQELESICRVRLFDRVGVTIKLTNCGRVFLKHALLITESYRALQFEMNLLTQNFTQTLHIGAGTTIAQYIIAPVIAKFMVYFPNIKILLIQGNIRQIERAMIEHRIDIGLVEGRSRRVAFRYSHFLADKLVLVTSAATSSPAQVSLRELMLLPLVLREFGSGTLKVIERTLAAQKVALSQMNVVLHVSNTESVKQFVCSSNFYTIVSMAAVADDIAAGKLKTVDIEELSFDRNFSFISLAGASDELCLAVEKFKQFALSYNSIL